MGRETRAWMTKSQSKVGTGQPMDRENSPNESESQSKASIMTAYGQRKREQDAEKSVQSWHGDSLWAEKREHG